MRISDWSSDVCSSDLTFALGLGQVAVDDGIAGRLGERIATDHAEALAGRGVAGSVLSERGGREGGGGGNGQSQCANGQHGGVSSCVLCPGGRGDRKSTRLNSSNYCASRIQSSA